jgi:hypothetical protein
MDARWIDIREEGEDSSEIAARPPLPHIGGANFFSGVVTDERSGSIGLCTSDQGDWDLFWRSALNVAPPGPLPPGAMAIIESEHHENNPVALEPRSVTRGAPDADSEGKNILSVTWNRNYIAEPGEPLPPSRYAVLLLPEGYNCGLYIDVNVAEENRKRREMLKEAEDTFLGGTRREVATNPPMKFKPKPP